MISSFVHLIGILALYTSFSVIQTIEGRSNRDIIFTSQEGQSNRVKYFVEQPKLVYQDQDQQQSSVQFDGDVYFSNDKQPWEVEEDSFPPRQERQYSSHSREYQNPPRLYPRKRFSSYNFRLH